MCKLRAVDNQDITINLVYVYISATAGIIEFLYASWIFTDIRWLWVKTGSQIVFFNLCLLKQIKE